MIESEEQARAYVAQLCDVAAMDRLARFVAALCAENVRQNLVAKPTLEIAWQRHIADSAQLLTYLEDVSAGPWLDLGTGAGLPGLVIAAMRPDLPVKLVESRRKRVDWLESMRLELGLANCEVIGSRLEMVESFPSGVISARAFAPLARLLDLSARFSTDDTVWLLPKGRSAAQELEDLPNRMRQMFHVEHSQTDSEAGIIVGKLLRKGAKKKP
ncbi:MAG: 16S rRNA (guanine(527)-N(7))-methyltransferase RsmG [Sphingomonadaceae bacterium]|nr:16S rRNA (guanine(527)-N(7))-methyltransferase RsmG [Sphingomonadaceae bacterium]